MSIASCWPRQHQGPGQGVYGSFRKQGVPYSRVLIRRILLFRVLYSGPLFSETPIYFGYKLYRVQGSGLPGLIVFAGFVGFLSGFEFFRVQGFVIWVLSVCSRTGEQDSILRGGVLGCVTLFSRQASGLAS